MDAELWQQVQLLFHRAAELEKTPREALLANVEDPRLAAEVRSLLDADLDIDEHIEGSIRQTLESAAALSESNSRQQIGPYRVLGEIGRGGLSTVYLGERADQLYQMKVAVKVVRRGMDTEDILRRLRQERQILANLDHPHIARLLDGGTTEDGLPFFAMEYIEGESIDTYCDSHQLSLAGRLRLFRELCSAVHYAHQNLIVHRDLKPSNILVTDDGTLKLLDFGIAKLLAPESYPQTVAPTVTGLRLLTPDYASPEQITGRTLTTATDVYSLGVVLYRLLTGRHPYELGNPRSRRAEQVICDTQPDKPSTVVGRSIELHGANGEITGVVTPDEVGKQRGISAERLSRHLSGDLDRIALMAMRKEPERRYPSAEQLSQDIRRHLEGRPVIARADTIGYRLQKLLVRHRTAAIATLAALLTIAGLATFYTVRLRRERDRAQVEATRAQNINDFLQQALTRSDPSATPDPDLTMREFLANAAARIESDLSDEPVVQASLMDLMGTAFLNLGQYNEANRLLRHALELRRRELGEFNEQTLESLSGLGKLTYKQGKPAEAEKILRHALAVAEKLFGKEHPETLLIVNDLAAVLDGQECYAEAEELLRWVVEITYRQAEDQWADLGTTLHNLAAVLHIQGNYDEAERYYRQALEVKLQQHQEHHPDIAKVKNTLGRLMEAKGELRQASLLYSEALQVNRALLGREHPDITQGLIGLAIVETKLGHEKTAKEAFTEALDLQRNLAPEGPMVSYILRFQGLTQLDHGSHHAAKQALEYALAHRLAFQQGDSFRIAQSQSDLGLCHLRQGDRQAAEKLLVGALAALSELRPSLSPFQLRMHELALERCRELYRDWRQSRLEEIEQRYGNPDPAAN